MTHPYFGLGLGWFLYLCIGYYPRSASRFDVSHTNVAAHGTVCTPLLCRMDNHGMWTHRIAVLVSMGQLVVYYVIPLFVFASWLVVTTFSITTTRISLVCRTNSGITSKAICHCVDRDYGLFQSLTHNIGTHQVHHLFPIIPHSPSAEATRRVSQCVSAPRSVN